MTWDKAYGVDLRATVPPHLRSRVLGGHGEMWGRARRVVSKNVAHAVHAGETVDPSDFDATVWPRLAAIGERLWSDVDDVDAARPRIEAFRCLLLERGVGAAPLNNTLARTAPVGPGACTQRRRRI